MPETKLLTSTVASGWIGRISGLQADLDAVIDEEKRQEFRQAAKDRRVDVAGQPQRRFARLLGERDEEADEQDRAASVAAASETVMKTP